MPMTDGLSGLECALNVSQSEAEPLSHSYFYDLSVSTPPYGKGDVLYILKAHSSWVVSIHSRDA